VPRPEDALARGVPRDAGAIPGGAPRPAETWLRIVQVHDRVTRRVDSALHRQHGLSMTGFEALRWLAESPGERASMGDLADAVGLSRAGITSTVNRLVADGLVLRERAGEDRRLFHARLTPAGRERVTAAARTHDDLVAHLLTLLGGYGGLGSEQVIQGDHPPLGDPHVAPPGHEPRGPKSLQ